MASGSITPAEAQAAAYVLDLQRKAVETVSLIERLDALEARLPRGG
jgi:hypothetical protein